MKYKNPYLVQGFSLIEVVIFTAVGAAIIFVISSLTSNVSNLEEFIGQKLQSRNSVEQVFQTLVTEIRSAGPSANGSYPIESATTSSLVLFSDIDQDGVFERVRYTLGTSTVSRGVIEPSGNPLVYPTSTEMMKNVIGNVATSTNANFFDYLDSTYTGTQSPMVSPIDISKIRVVRVSVYVDTNPGKAPKPLLFSDTITIRNLRSN